MLTLSPLLRTRVRFLQVWNQPRLWGWRVCYPGTSHSLSITRWLRRPRHTREGRQSSTIIITTSAITCSTIFRAWMGRNRALVRHLVGAVVAASTPKLRQPSCRPPFRAAVSPVMGVAWSARPAITDWWRTMSLAIWLWAITSNSHLLSSALSLGSSNPSQSPGSSKTQQTPQSHHNRKLHIKSDWLCLLHQARPPKLTNNRAFSRRSPSD